MNLIPFNEKSYQRLIKEGYKYLLVKKRNHKHPSDINNYADVQILKAMKDCEDIPQGDNCEPIVSEPIATILNRHDLVSFVIISG